MTTTDTTTTSLHDHYDVVIVGARAAGAATAMLLARAGLRVAAIDKGTYGSDTLSTHAIARTGVLLLNQWGVLDAIRAADTPRANTMLFHYGDNDVAIDIRPRGEVDGLYSPRRTVLDRSLVDAAVDAGAAIRHGTAVQGVVKDRTGRVVGVDIDDGGVHRMIGARFVIGADGMSSRVAGQVGAVTLREEIAYSGVVYSYFSGVANPHIIENDFRPGQAAGVIPTNNGETCVWIALPGEEFRSRVADGVEAAFDRGVEASPALQARLDGASRTSRFRSFPGRKGFLRQSWGAGWALVGDSAYFKDPVSAHGITDALIGAELLADALVSALRGGDDRRALSHYQHERNLLAGPMMPAVARLAGFGWDTTTVADAFRDMSAAMGREWDYFESRNAILAAA
jgi:flavin-dependent dehydrogenase